MIVVLDVNGQPDRLLHPFTQGLSIAPIDTLILAGSTNTLNAWSEKIRASAPAQLTLHTIRCGDRKAESVIALAFEVALLFERHNGAEHKWVVISQKQGFEYIAERILRLGAPASSWTPAPTVDFLHSIIHSSKDHALFIREIAERLIGEAGNKPIPIAKLANTVITLAPEMKSQEHRRDLFGAVQFSLICKTVGLTIKDNCVQPLKRE